MLKRVSRSILMLLIASTTVVAFQNCGESSHTELLSNENEFFYYPYKSAPTFYSDIQLFRQPQAAGLSEFVLVATVAFAADATAPINYTVRIANADGAVLCPTQTGTLVTGVTRIMFNCVSTVSSNEARIRLTVTAKGQTETFTKSY